MISPENQKFLLDTFKVDASRYSKEELNHILDFSMEGLKDRITKKIINIKHLEDELASITGDY